MRHRDSIIATILFLMVSTPAAGQADRARPVSLDAASTAIARVRAKYYAMDYMGGVAEADRLLAQFPRSRELAAWRVANLARADRPREAQAAADKLLAANRSDPWGWFARTLYSEYAADDGAAAALDASAQAHRLAPNQPAIVWLRALTLSSDREPAKALALIDSVAARGPLSQEMLDLRANTVYNIATATRKTDQRLLDSAFALYDAARRLDSADVAAYVFPASRMLNLGRQAEAYTLAKRGVELSPTSLAVHQYYWRAIDGLKDRSQAARDSEALADVEALLRSRGGEPTVLSSAAEQYRSRRQPDRARELEERILAIAPTSFAAEWVYVTRYRAMQRDLADSTIRDSALKSRYISALWAFVDRASHQRDRVLGDAYRELFYKTDSATNADTLLRVVRGMIKYEGINPHVTYTEGAIRLAQRGRDFREAERIARDGLKAGKDKIDSQKQIYETVGDYARALDWMSSVMYDALGVVYMREGRLADAEKQLMHARDLDPTSVKALYHLGQLAERRGAPEAAERFYAKGSLLSTMGSNPNRVALKQVYQSRRGSLDGFDIYMAGLAEADRASRRSDIAKSRAANPPPMSPFALTTLDGRSVSLDSLRGKMAVINNWGMWCGPCVAEMPDVQKLATRFASDTTVRILTIDNDPNTDELRSWMQKKGYTFTTLIDDGYTKRVGIRGYPTTWFVDPAGRVVFTKIGWSENLVEEFGWRIEMIQKP